MVDVIKTIKSYDQDKISEMTGIPKKHVVKVIEGMVTMAEGRKRCPKEPPPEGGITIRQAERKFSIASATISTWVQKGYIPIIKETRNEKYIDECRLIKVLEVYHQSPGQGKSTLKEAFSDSTN